MQVGEKVTVTTQTGQVFEGTLASLTASELSLNTAHGPQVLPGNELTKIQARRPDSLWTGGLIGVAVGVTPVVIVAASKCDNEDTYCDNMVLSGVLFAGVGGLVGVLIDALHKSDVTIMKHDLAGGKTVSFAPLVAKGRKGVLCSVGF